MPHNAQLISCLRMFKLKYRDGSYECHHALLVAMGYQHGKGHDYFESYPPTCVRSTIWLVLALTSESDSRWHSLDLDAVCAFISIDLTEGERVYMKGSPGHDIGNGNCFPMLKCTYGLVLILFRTFEHQCWVHRSLSLERTRVRYPRPRPHPRLRPPPRQFPRQPLHHPRPKTCGQHRGR